MTVTSTTTKTAAILGNGSNKTFSFSPMVIYASTDIIVVKKTVATGVEEVLIEGTSATTYSINIAVLGYPATGSITYPALVSATAMSSDYQIVIKRELPITQTTDLQNQGGYFPDTQETIADKSTIVNLQQQEELDRSLKGAIADATTLDMTIPAAVDRANKYLTFSSTGEPTATDAATASGTSVLATGTTTARLLADRAADVFNVLDFGVTGDGVTDDTTAIQAAIDATPIGGVVFFPVGVYLITATLTVTEGIWLIGYHGQAGGLTGAPTGMVTRILWDAATSGAVMMLWKSTSALTVITRGGILGITFDGANVATVGLQISSAAYSEFDIKTYRTVAKGLLIDSGNSKLTNALRFMNFEHFCGSNSLAEDCLGIFIDGDDSATASWCTNIIFDSAEVECVEGHGVTIRGADSVLFKRLKSYDRSTQVGTPFNLRFLASVNDTSFHAQKNVIEHMIAGGRIWYGDYTKNNTIVNNMTETGLITHQSDAANKRTNHILNMIDFRDGDSWRTHQFKLNDYKDIALHSCKLYGTTATSSTLGSTSAGTTWSFDPSTQNGISYSGIVPIDWNAGFIRGVRIVLYPGTSVTDKDAVFIAQSLSVPNTSGIGALVRTTGNQTLRLQDTVNALSIHELLFTTEQATYLEGIFLITLERVAADGADNHTGAAILAGMSVIYRGAGPGSSGYGPYGRFMIGGSDANP